jgi:dipeptidyl aminopeptidase/acylaminoacyl peptidase
MYAKTGMTPDYASGTDLWIADTRTGETKRVTDGKGAVEEPVFSPDGRSVAFYSDRDGAARIWVWDSTSRELRRVSDAVVRPSLFDDAHLRWTPDGRGLVALLLPEGSTLATAEASGADEAKPSAGDPTTAPGATVVVRRSSARAPESAVPSAEKKPEDRPVDTSHLFAVMEADLALVDAGSGAVRRFSSRKAVFWYAPSPDGRWIAFAHQSGRLPSSQQTFYDLEAAPLEGVGGPARLLSRFTRADYGFCAWSPDSTRLAYAGAGKPPSGDVHVVDVAQAKDRLASTGAQPDFGDQKNLKPLWTPDGQTLLIAGNGRLWRVPASGGELRPVTPEGGREVALVVANASGNAVWQPETGGRGAATATAVVVSRDPAGKNIGFARVDLASGASARLRDEPKRYGLSSGAPIVSSDGKVVVWSAEDARHPPDLWAAGPALEPARQLTHLNPQIDRLHLGGSRLIEYLGIDGRPLHGALLLPSDYREGHRVPLVVRPYPGAWTHSNDLNRFGLEGATDVSNMQMFATRGYAVLSAEIPQRPGTPMRDLMDGIHAAVNRTIEMGIADPDRLAIFGQSYGGYATLSVIVQTDRFKAAAMSAGLSDLFSDYGHLGDSGADGSAWAEAGQGLMRGTPWTETRRYFENSPIFFLDRVTTPLLILHGDRDTAVPVQQAEEAFVGLRRLGREVEYRKYIGEEHAPQGKENLIDYWSAVIRWFDRYAKNAPTNSSNERSGQ